jgi:hypothetical protein
MNATLMSLLVVEAVLTGAAVVMFLYRGMLDMKEEDHLILDNAEAHLAREQATIRHKLDVVSKYLKLVAVLWAVLLLAIFGVWVSQGLGLV